jgi:hypothetical protein
MSMNTTRAAELINSPVHLTEDERAEAREMIKKGELPPDALERQADAEARNVYGADAKKDRNGKYLEQGVGSRGHESLNHFTALLRAEQQGLEPAGSYKKAVEEIYRRDPKRAAAIGLPPPPQGVTA